MSDLSTEAVTISAEELEAAHAALKKLSRIHAGNTIEWHIVMAARSVVHDDLMLSLHGEVPGV